MPNRLDLQTELEQVLGSANVYFQPPPSLKMKYPAIIYFRENIDNDFANDGVYNQAKAYRVVVVDPDPDSDIVDKVSRLPMVSFSRHYESDNLNHDVFVLYYNR